MPLRNRTLLPLGALLLCGVVAFTIRQTHAEPFFFLPSPEPQAVDPIVVHAGPAGVRIYFGLRSADGRATRADGQVELVLSSRQKAVYRGLRSIRAVEFAQARLPGPSGSSWLLVYGYGWLDYRDNLGSPPPGPLQVEVTFTTPGGRVLHGISLSSIPG